MKKSKRRRKYIGTALQKKLLVFILISALLPSAIITATLYYLIFNMLAWQLGIPEAIAYNLIPVVDRVNLIIFIALPVCLFFIWMLALELSNRIAGPIYRLEKELGDRISGEKSGPINVREKDEIKSLVDKINRFIEK